MHPSRRSDPGLEASLIRLIQERPRDPEPRLVYADWLEEQGEVLRAEYVRLQLRLSGLGANPEQSHQDTNRFREISKQIPLEWRGALSFAAIEACVSFEVACPKAWDRLQPTDRERVRFCSTCRSNVHYCGSILEARGHASEGHCVVLDLSVPRFPGDLRQGPPPMAGHILPLADLPAPPELPAPPRPKGLFSWFRRGK